MITDQVAVSLKQEFFESVSSSIKPDETYDSYVEVFLSIYDRHKYNEKKFTRSILDAAQALEKKNRVRLVTRVLNFYEKHKVELVNESQKEEAIALSLQREHILNSYKDEVESLFPVEGSSESLNEEKNSAPQRKSQDAVIKKMSKEHIEELAELLNCPIDSEPLTFAVTFPCGHNFNQGSVEIIHGTLNHLGHCLKQASCSICNKDVPSYIPNPTLRDVAVTIEKIAKTFEEEQQEPFRQRDLLTEKLRQLLTCQENSKLLTMAVTLPTGKNVNKETLSKGEEYNLLLRQVAQSLQHIEFDESLVGWAVLSGIENEDQAKQPSGKKQSSDSEDSSEKRNCIIS